MWAALSSNLYSADAPCLNPPCGGSDHVVPDDGTTPGEEEALRGADIEVRMTISPRQVDLGDRIAFAISVQNLGPEKAVLAYLDNRNLHPFRVTQATTTKGGCSINNFSVGCSFGDLAPGERVWVNMDAETLVGGVHAHTATGSSDTPDPNPANNNATISVTVVPPPGPPPPPPQHCCTCIQGSGVNVSCDTLLHNNGCDISKTLPYAEYISPAQLCPGEWRKEQCDSHQIIVNSHGGPIQPDGTGGGVLEFKYFINAVKHVCDDPGYAWCKSPFQYTGQFCYSGQNWLELFKLCNETPLSEDCAFEFEGNQSLCYNEGGEPYLFSAPIKITRSRGHCQAVFPSCSAMDGAECAPDGLKYLQTLKYGNVAVCKDRNGELRDVHCKSAAYGAIGLPGGVWVVDW